VDFGGRNPCTIAKRSALEFLQGSQQITRSVIVLQTGWEQQLEANTQAFFAEFVQRSRFTLALHDRAADIDDSGRVCGQAQSKRREHSVSW
jgi:hypothetical protein